MIFKCQVDRSNTKEIVQFSSVLFREISNKIKVGLCMFKFKGNDLRISGNFERSVIKSVSFGKG